MKLRLNSFTLISTLILIGIPFAAMVLAEWVSSPRASAKPPSARPPTPTVAIADRCDPETDGICVIADGLLIAIPGQVDVTRYANGPATSLRLAKNQRPSIFAGGNGIVFELQTAPGIPGNQDSFSTADVASATISVWKGSEFGHLYLSAQPGQPLPGLTLTPTDGKIVGSFEAQLSGLNDKVMPARATFHIPLPQ
jgi:hypothetical protein